MKDYPGTRKRIGQKCNVCHLNKLNLTDEQLAEREKRKRAVYCIKCDFPLRPSHALLKDYPGTRRTAMVGVCSTCSDNKGQLSGRSFVESSLVEQLNKISTPPVGEKEYRIVRRLIEDRYEGDDYLLSVLGLVGEDD